MPPSDAISWYSGNAERLASLYGRLSAADVLRWLDGLLPAAPATVLDIGAGMGRDAAWFAALGYDVVAVEPAAGMREIASSAHTTSPRIRWLDDRLPALQTTVRLGISFDLISLSAVWMHVAPGDRPRALRKLVTLLKPGGLLAITLRVGPSEPERVMHPVSLAELEQLSLAHGLAVVRIREVADALGRADVSWIQVALRLPDDGTGALQLLRHIILNAAKSSTYKLGLLRVLCRVADGMSGFARENEEGGVVLPLGLVALIWLRLYLPLLRANLPQSPINRHGAERLKFAGPGFRALMDGGQPPHMLRVGNSFLGPEAQAVHAALADAASVIAEKPAFYTTYPNGGQVLPAMSRRPPKPASGLHLDAIALGGYGDIVVPPDLWRAFQRFACWVEPALVTEWARLMRDYAESQDRPLDEGTIAAALTWADPERDVSMSRSIATSMLEAGRPLRCVWSGKKLDVGSFDIDHCFPWSAWPCSDLWNLVPADRSVNQHRKRDLLPSDNILIRARQPIIDWWHAAYMDGQVLPKRFTVEASASLPGLTAAAEAATPAEVFDAMRLQRLRLRYDQQVPEWTG